MDAEQAAEECPGHAEADVAGGGREEGGFGEPGVAAVAAGAEGLAAAVEGELASACRASGSPASSMPFFTVVSDAPAARATAAIPP
ncbi:MAG TPA: hypothetical protein VG164_06835 [Trebonia sp.]|nr:hypothetical protein [Trebonia sp.]